MEAGVWLTSLEVSEASPIIPADLPLPWAFMDPSSCFYSFYREKLVPAFPLAEDGFATLGPRGHTIPSNTVISMRQEVFGPLISRSNSVPLLKLKRGS